LESFLENFVQSVVTFVLQVEGAGRTSSGGVRARDRETEISSAECWETARHQRTN